MPLSIDLAGKHALVTGSTKGIGYAIAKRLAEAGARVTLNGRDTAGVKQAIDRMQHEVPGAEIGGLAADLANAAEADRLISDLGGCDILVNNAGIFGAVDFFEADDDLWQKYWDVNVMSGMRLARALAPGMVKKGWGRILFLGSESSFNIPDGMIHYGVTKAADVALARGLAKRLAETGVTVNSLLPGPTLSDGMKAGLDTSDGRSEAEVARDFVKSARPSSIIGRAADVEEVANMALYACSPLSSATTGASLRVEGGIIDTP